MFNAYINKVHGYEMTMNKLSRGIMLMIFSYLTTLEHMSLVNGVNRRLRDIASDPYLWRSISVNCIKDGQSPFKEIILQQTASRLPEKINIFSNLLLKSNQLRVLSLRYCQHAGEDAMELIADNVNPFALKELYLDGCESINDDALHKLTKQRSSNQRTYPIPDLGDTSMIALRQVANSNDDYRKMILEISLGGIRSLEVLSLSECR